LPSWPGDDWHSVALAPELISSSATAMDELALVTRALLAAWSARRAPSAVLFFGVVPACMADILHSSATLATESGRRLHDVFRLKHDQHDVFRLIRNPKSLTHSAMNPLSSGTSKRHAPVPALFRTDPEPG
jgi:hypothetical protein